MSVWPLLAELKVPTFDGHLNESNTNLRRCSMDYKPRRKLTREFKLEAVRQVALSEKPKAQLARELGVRVGQLRTWRLEFEKEAVTGIAKPDRSAAEDLEQLRRVNAKLKMEIEILKKKRPSTLLGNRSEVRLRREESTAVRRAGPVRGAAGLAQRLLRCAPAGSQCSLAAPGRPHDAHQDDPPGQPRIVRRAEGAR